MASGFVISGGSTAGKRLHASKQRHESATPRIGLRVSELSTITSVQARRRVPDPHNPYNHYR